MAAALSQPAATQKLAPTQDTELAAAACDPLSAGVAATVHAVPSQDSMSGCSGAPVDTSQPTATQALALLQVIPLSIDCTVLAGIAGEACVQAAGEPAFTVCSGTAAATASAAAATATRAG